MAVAYHHRLVACGPPEELKALRGAMGLTVTRKPIVKIPEWREYVPISFAAMYARCPRLARVEANLPYDPTTFPGGQSAHCQTGAMRRVISSISAI